MFGMSREGLGDLAHDDLMNKPVEDYHLDSSKMNEPAEKLIQRVGIEGAKAELEDALKQNPGNEEARRQLNLINSGKLGRVQ